MSQSFDNSKQSGRTEYAHDVKKPTSSRRRKFTPEEIKKIRHAENFDRLNDRNLSPSKRTEFAHYVDKPTSSRRARFTKEEIQEIRRPPNRAINRRVGASLNRAHQPRTRIVKPNQTITSNVNLSDTNQLYYPPRNINDPVAVNVANHVNNLSTVNANGINQLAQDYGAKINNNTISFSVNSNEVNQIKLALSDTSPEVSYSYDQMNVAIIKNGKDRTTGVKAEKYDAKINYHRDSNGVETGKVEVQIRFKQNLHRARIDIAKNGKNDTYLIDPQNRTQTPMQKINPKVTSRAVIPSAPPVITKHSLYVEPGPTAKPPESSSFRKNGSSPLTINGETVINGNPFAADEHGDAEKPVTNLNGSSTKMTLPQNSKLESNIATVVSAFPNPTAKAPDSSSFRKKKINSSNTIKRKSQLDNYSSEVKTPSPQIMPKLKKPSVQAKPTPKTDGSSTKMTKPLKRIIKPTPTQNNGSSTKLNLPARPKAIDFTQDFTQEKSGFSAQELKNTDLMGLVNQDFNMKQEVDTILNSQERKSFIADLKNINPLEHEANTLKGNIAKRLLARAEYFKAAYPDTNLISTEKNNKAIELLSSTKEQRQSYMNALRSDTAREEMKGIFLDSFYTIDQTDSTYQFAPEISNKDFSDMIPDGIKIK